MSSTYTVNYTASDVVWGGGTYTPPTTDYDPNNPDHCAVALMQTEGGWGVVDEMPMILKRLSLTMPMMGPATGTKAMSTLLPPRSV